jgi:hypothetical protein
MGNHELYREVPSAFLYMLSFSFCWVDLAELGVISSFELVS